ncbi:Ppx/GppA family phosphatase [Nitrospirillum sp. BR 11828]|uniref:Ppx/GppA family phosphatase n=1 Tax=Nitrospirillum sp. BR 11828 TaxID=3104325 RepID=UPI002ACA4E98|nr:Ppx/GppA family phosphatase [Nitrospirillum sp. BR 11828]MDZ5649707.1 Ppx/GppA family phosphatase [Nitrospirillum sp. BR 11828]
MPVKFDRPAPERHVGSDRLAVIDIGSNSMRVVVYDRLERSPIAIFNEKIMCGLGRSVEKTGKLHPEGVKLALANLARFRRLIEGMQVGRVDILATAAVRDAKDGAKFVADVEALTGVPVTVLAGEEEARLSAMGVLSGTPGADGLMGDLGGGSLELVTLDKGVIGRQATLPLGPLRLIEAVDGKPGSAAKLIDAQLAKLPWALEGRGRDFHPVGGGWRALAKMHMEQIGHPLHIIHHYVVDARVMADFAGLVGRQSRASLEKMPGVSRRRLETLPMAALVMERLLRAVQPSNVVFSAYGLREGFLFDQLSAEERRRDPLIDSCTQVAERLGRFGEAATLTQWTSPLFAGEDEAAARLRTAACLLSDLGWSEHPDYRAEHAYLRVLRMPFAGADHAERAFLALASFVRYAGTADGQPLGLTRTLLSEAQLSRAVIVGLALRLAHTLTGGAATLLQRTALRLTPDTLTLLLPRDAAMLDGDAVQRRLDALAKTLGRKGTVVVQQAPTLADTGA